MGQPERFELCYGTSLTGTKGAPVLIVEQQNGEEDLLSIQD